MSVFIFTNNAASTLDVALTIDGLSITLPTGEGALFASPAGIEQQSITLLDYAGYIEICHVTGKSGDILTVTRGQDGTAARAWPEGTFVEARLTRADMNNFAQLDGVQNFAGDVNTQNLGVTGNISISGNVDGRDVAVDGAKLDTIEDSATADQTGAEIKALYEVEPNAFTNILFSKLAAIEAGATADQTGAEIKALYEVEVNAFTDTLFTFLSSLDVAINTSADATAITIDASENVAFAGDISLADNKRTYWGSGAADYYAYHDGAASYLTNQIGQLNIWNRANSGLINFATDNSAGTIKTGISIGGAIPDVRLNYSGVEKLRTTSIGVDIWSGAGTDTVVMSLGKSRTGDGYAYIDLIGDTTNPYGLRIIRNNTGVNTTSYLHHAGTGSFVFRTNDAASILFQTNGGNTALTIDSSQNATFVGDVSLADNKTLYLGTDDDLRIKHTGAIGSIVNNVGALYITQAVDGGSIFLDTHNSVGTNKTNIRLGGSTPYVRLYYDGLEVMSTVSNGINLGNSKYLYLGAGNKARLYNDGADTYLQQILTGTMYLENRASSQIVSIRSENSVGTVKNGIVIGGTTPFVKLYYNGILAAETEAGGLFANHFTEKQLSTTQASAYAADFDNGSVFEVTMTGNVAITFSNIPITTRAITATFILKHSGAGRTPTFPASVKWDGGTIPTWGTAAGNEDIVTMFTYDGGTTWRANLVGQNYA